MLTGTKKVEYQREYMREWQRKRRLGLNKKVKNRGEGLNIRSKQGLNIPVKVMEEDADGNEIPEL